MRSARTVLSSTAKASAPRGSIERVRFRMSLDMILTLAVTILAVGMALGYQVIRRLGPGTTASR